MPRWRIVTVLAGLLTLAAVEAACDKGPAQKTGEKVDRALDTDKAIGKGPVEKAGKADRRAVGDALHTIDLGPSNYYPGGQLKFDEKGLRVGAGLTIIQWQDGVPKTVYPENLALSKAVWPKSR